MKIRHPGLIKGLALVGSMTMRGWLATMNIHYRPLGPNMLPARWEGLPRCIYAFWHEHLFILCRYARRDIHVLVSRHADGELIARVCQHLGFNLVRGSTSRGGVEALWKMIRLGEQHHLAITPDGPRGPRRKVQPGLVYLAAKTGLPIVPIGVAYQKSWRLSSWDRFALPCPGSTAYGITAEPIRVPGHADRRLLEQYRLRVEEELNSLGNMAEQRAATGRWPATPYLLAGNLGTKAA